MLQDDELAALGSVAAESAYLENTVDDSIKAIVRMSDAQYEVFTAKSMLGTKLDILLSVGELRLKSKKRKKRFKDIISRLKHLNHERTLAIHGLWESVYDQNEGMTWYKYFFTPQSKWPKRIGAKVRNSRTKDIEPLSTNRLDNLAEDLHVGTGALHTFMHDVWEKKRKRLRVIRALAKQRVKSAPQ